jgi:hypothetical protein
MLLAEALADAIGEPVVRKISLAVGQWVVVRTPTGDRVGAGFIEAIYPDSKTVLVRNVDSGTDLNVVVDPNQYDLWVEPVPADYGTIRNVYMRHPSAADWRP